MKKIMGKRFFAVVVFIAGILILNSLAFATANTVTTSTGVVAGTDATFTVSYNTTLASGVIVYLNYTKGTESGIALTFTSIAPSISATDQYQYIVPSTGSVYTITLTATGKYRIPIPVIYAETVIMTQIVFGSAAQGGVAVINFKQP